jgi:uncharacterized membrane protein
VRDAAAGVRADGSIERHGLAARRLGAAAVAGSVTLAALLGTGVVSVPVAVDASWDAAALTVLAWVWLSIAGKDAEETARLAGAEDVSRPTADAIMLSASVVSLVAVGFVLSQASRQSGTTKGLLIGLAVLSVALAWATVHTLYTLRYGDLYYRRPSGGIDFHSDEPPDYLDLAYVALTIGMTYQVSDTDLTAKPIRHTAVRHALLSFLFSAVIVAIAINIVAGLLGH